MKSKCMFWKCPEACNPCYEEVCQYVISLPKVCATCFDQSIYPCSGQIQNLPQTQ